MRGLFTLSENKNESWVNNLSEHFQIRIFESGRNIDEQTMNWSYINFLQTKDIILVPGIGRKKLDNEALAEIKTHFPDYAKRNAVHQILMPSVIKKGGALNCVSWGTN